MFKQNEVLIDKPIYLEFSILDLSRLLMYETHYDKLQPYFIEKISVALYGYRFIRAKYEYKRYF